MENAAEKKIRRCTEEANLARQEEILETATELFAEYGFSDAVTQALADRLGVGKGTIYRHFPSKPALFLSAADRVMRKLQEAVCEQVAGITDGLVRVERGISTFLKFFADHPSFVELLIQERAFFKDRQRPTYFEHHEVNTLRWRQLYREMIADGRIRDIPVEQISSVVSNVMYGIMVTNFFNGETKPPEVQAKEILDIVFLGILTDSERQRRVGVTPARDPGCLEVKRRETSFLEVQTVMNRRWWMVLIAPVLLASLAATGCQPAQSAPAKTIPIAVYELPITRVVTDYEEFPGQTDSIYSVQVRARVSGYMTNVYFKDGSMVAKDDKLFEIDPRMYKADLDRAKGTVQQYEAHLARLDKEYHRAKNLLAKRSISQEEYDRYESDYKEAVANVEVARANRDLAALNLEWTEVRSPIDGLLSRRMVDPGNLIKADDTALTSIVSLDPLYVYFDVHEQAMLKIKRLLQGGKLSKVKAQGDKEVPVQIGLSDEQNFPHQGIVDFTDNRVDLNTGTLRFRAKISNPTDQNGNRFIVPGLFVRVRLPIGDPHSALMVREQALVTDQGRKTVFVIRDKTDKDGRPVLNEKEEPIQVTMVRDVGTPGVLRDGFREVEKGIEPGDRIVVSGMQRLRPGAEVKAEKYDEKAPTSATGKSEVKKDTTVAPGLPAGPRGVDEPAGAAPAKPKAAAVAPGDSAPASPRTGQGTGSGAVDPAASSRPVSSSLAPLVPTPPRSGRSGPGNRPARQR